MPLNGSGVASAPAADFPAVPDTLIESSKFNNVINDIYTVLTTALYKDGQQTVTGNIAFGGFRITGLGNPTASTDAMNVRSNQGELGIYVATVGGTADAISLTASPAITAYAAGQRFTFIASGANTTNVTVSINSVGSKAITKRGSTALVAGDIISGQLVTIIYDGTRFQLAGSVGDAARKSTAETISAQWTFTGLGSASASSVTMASELPLLRWEETDATANEGHWQMFASTDAFIFRATKDDNSGSSIIFQVERTAEQIDTVNFATGTLQYGGIEVGFRGIPQNAQNGNYTAVAADAGKHIYKASGGAGETYTIPANASVAYAIGTVLMFINRGGGALTIAITSDTLEQAGSGSTGSRTLADKGRAVAVKVDTTVWQIDGTGLS